MSRPVIRLSLRQARRIALTAQALSGADPDAGTRAGWPALDRTIRRLNLLQIDSVNVLSRSHYLPLQARLGGYDRALLDRHTLDPRRRRCFEYWAHEASFLPLDLHPLLRWRMADARDGVGIYRGLARFARERADYVAGVLDRVRRAGPTRVRDLGEGGAGRPGEWWGWSDAKAALEYLFWTGDLTVSARLGFERVYDVPERVLPDAVLSAPEPPRADAVRHLALLSARALGVATETDIRDYFRLPPADARRAVAELVEAGELTPVEVGAWQRPAYLTRDARPARRFERTVLLSPFDPVVWERDRAERLFGFTYRIEIYTPAEKRIYGYYVLPLLVDDRLAGRVCLKADRQAGVLRVNAAHHEPGETAAEIAGRLAGALARMAGWLGLERVEAAAGGNLAPALGAALRSRPRG